MTARRPELLLPGKSTCVISPVTTTFELNPNRVRNIFICSPVVFCASSRMMNESERVLPRMYPSGATSITPALINFGISAGSIMSCSASYKRPQIRIDLLAERAWQEAEALTGFHRRTGQDDPVDLFRL